MKKFYIEIISIYLEKEYLFGNERIQNYILYINQIQTYNFVSLYNRYTCITYIISYLLYPYIYYIIPICAHKLHCHSKFIIFFIML